VLIDGVSNQHTDAGIISLDIEQGLLQKAEFQNYKGTVVYDIYGENGSAVAFDSNGDLRNAIIKESVSGSEILVRNGQYLKNQNATSTDDLLKQSQPWYEKFAVSKAADFTDQKLDDIANFILGEAQNNMGWIVGATALNSTKDILKGTITDVLRFGSSLPGALDDFSGAWQDAKNGNPMSAGYKALLGSGKILQEVGRALVIGSVVRGLAVSAVKSEVVIVTRQAIPSSRLLMGAKYAPTEYTVAGERFVRVGARPKTLNRTFKHPGAIEPDTYAIPESVFNQIGRDPQKLKDLLDLPGDAPTVFTVFEAPVGTPIKRGITPGGEFGGSGGAIEIFFPEGS